MTWNLPHKFEKNSLVPLSRRLSFFYVEYAKITKQLQSISIFRDDSKGGYFTLPPASMGALLIGPGTSITTEALRVLSTRGCLVGVTGGSLVNVSCFNAT